MAKRPDGKYESRLGSDCVVEFAEDPVTGLWEAEILRHDVPLWQGTGYATMDEAQRAARAFHERSGA